MAPPSSTAETSQRRTWLAASLGTVLVTISLWSFVYAFVGDSAGEERGPLAAATLGMAVIPLVFVIVAFVSGHPSAPLAVVKAMTVSLLFGIPALAIFRDVVTGLVIGFGAGGVVAFNREPHSKLGARSIAVALAGLATLVLTAVFPPLGLATAPSLPLTATALADRRRLLRASAQGKSSAERLAGK